MNDLGWITLAKHEAGRHEWRLAGGFYAWLSVDEVHTYEEWVSQQFWYRDLRRSEAVSNAMRIEAGADGIEMLTFCVTNAMDIRMECERVAYSQSKSWYDRLLAERDAANNAESETTKESQA